MLQLLREHKPLAEIHVLVMFSATREMFEHVGPRFPYPQRAMFANLWLTRPLVLRTLQRSPTTNAMVRTTNSARR